VCVTASLIVLQYSAILSFKFCLNYIRANKKPIHAKEIAALSKRGQAFRSILFIVSHLRFESFLTVVTETFLPDFHKLF